MAGRSIATQRLLLQKEVTPGTAVTNAMKEVLGLRVMPGYGVEGDSYKASGFKVPTSYVKNSEVGTHTVETIQEFNAFTYVATGAFGAPTSTGVTDAVGDATEHVYTLDANGADTKATFTMIYGDATQSIQATHFFFNTLGVTIQRGQLTLTTSAMSYKPTTGAAIPGSGITTVGTIPVAGRYWDVYADDSWATLGTTKLLAAYEGGIDFGDKYTPDWVINSALASFDSIIENDDLEPSANLTLGFDATAVGLLDDWDADTLKFIRLAATGPVIDETTAPADINAEIEIDLCVRITQPGEFTRAPNSPAVALPFTGQVEVDPTSGNAAAARIVNLLTAL